MKPRVTYSNKWWRVYYGTQFPVGVYGTWERALHFANLISHEQREQS